MAGLFTPAERDRLRQQLVSVAEADPRIVGAAITGSAASGSEDRWSDIDLFSGVLDSDLAEALDDWTAAMYAEHAASHHVDVLAGATVYRVFLLKNTLQVDLAFAPASEFGAVKESTFRLLFGTPVSRTPAPAPSAVQMVGLAWLHALHARSSVARGRRWQAEYLISGVRDQVLALACLRHGLPATQGRGLDGLPEALTSELAGSLLGALDDESLTRALRVVVEALLTEVRALDPGLADRLDRPLSELAASDLSQ